MLPQKLKCLYMLEWYTLLESECRSEIEKEKTPSLDVLFYHTASLYHQCLSQEHNKEFLKAKANEAKQNLEILYQSPYKEKITPIYAQILGFLDEFERSSSLFLEMKESAEMLFQAALMQEKYDKEKAVTTFQKVATKTQDKKLKEKC